MAENQAWMPDALTKGEPTLAACFAAVVEMQSLLVDATEARKQVAMVCLYGWDLSCLPNADARRKEIARLWQARTVKGSDTPAMRQWFEEEIESIISLRRTVFPTLGALVTSATIALVDTSRDQLAVETTEGLECFDIPRLNQHTLADGLGRRITAIWDDAEELEYWQEDAGVAELEQHREALLRTCGIWRVKLSKFRELASDLHRVQVAAPAKRVTAEWVSIAQEADQRITALLQAV